MPRIGAVIGAALRSLPGVGVLGDNPTFRDPGPGQYRPSQRAAAGPAPQTKGPRIHHHNRGVSTTPVPRAGGTQVASRSYVTPPQPPAPKPTYADLGINEGQELAALPLETIPSPKDPMPVMVPRTASDLEKQKCWEKTVAHTLMGAGTGFGGGVVAAQVACLSAPGPWTVVCEIGLYVLGAAGGATALGLNAHADNCLTEPKKE